LQREAFGPLTDQRPRNDPYQQECKESVDPEGTPGSLLVRDVVLMEAVWTLKSAFEQDQGALLIAVRSLFEETAFAFEDREAIAAALSLFEAGSCGYGACLAAATHARQACEFTAVFDRGMRKLPGLKVL
jgi:predicted nucleic-acid-binding protein